MKDKKAFLKLIVLIIILFIAGFFYFYNQLEISFNENKTNEEYEACKGKDCILTQITCCPCNAGGKEVCLNKKDSIEYEEKLKSCPKDLACPQVFNCQIDSCLE